ncbi:hypothetical protein B0H12DRAFT_1007129, partial [Mycena haematopus]
RITLTRFTIAFFLFSFIHCFAEGFIQAFIFSLDANASNIVTSIIHQAEVPRNNFGILTRHDGNARLSVCNDIPTYFRTYMANEPHRPTNRVNLFLRRATPTCRSHFNTAWRCVEISPSIMQIYSIIPKGNTSNVFLDITVREEISILMNQMCTLVLTYPHQVLMNAQREDIVLVMTQFWIFSVSFFAIVYDSIPHLVAALCFRILATAWSMYIIWRTGDVLSRFDILLSSADSPCHVDVDTLFPSYFESRRVLQIPDLSLNVIALCLGLYLSRKLIKVYGPNTFNRVGAPKEIIRVYKYFLAVFVSFQLSALLLISAVCLWLDQMVDPNNAISGMRSRKTLYIALSVFTLVVLLFPFRIQGWYSVRREWKKLMFVFLVLAAGIFVCWLLMLKSWIFAWTFVQWPFFACSIIVASLSLLATFVFGVISWLHFGKGLAHYLYVDGVLAKAGFEPELFEKDVESHPPSDWREIGLDDIPTYTLSFSTEKKDLGNVEEKGDYK